MRTGGSAGSMTPRLSTTSNLPVVRLGDVHVHPHVVLAGHHLGRTARALGDPRVVERLRSTSSCSSEPASSTAASQSFRPRYMPEHALPAVNLALPGKRSS